MGAEAVCKAPANLNHRDHAMTARKHYDEWSDEDLLWALQARDKGWTCKQIGEHFGRTKNAVIGALHKVARDLEQSEGKQ